MNFTTSRPKLKNTEKNTSFRKAKMQKDGEPNEQNSKKDWSAIEKLPRRKQVFEKKLKFVNFKRQF